MTEMSLEARNAAQAGTIRSLFEENERLRDKAAALTEEIDLLRARSPRRYILARKSEWVRLFREVHGYMRVCHRQHGTDWDGRNHAMNALVEAMRFMEADDAARDTILATLREAEANRPASAVGASGSDGEGP